ncbi:MAG TPA: hypothetical protein VFZ65_07455 [Planctomycetota bacterium]|nr:hypothetical protein [Planctomycetota bacterium]
MRSSTILASLLASLFAGTCSLPAQAHLRWKAGEAAPGPTNLGSIYTCTWWDPDGSGPRGEVLVLGGYFSIPSVGAENLATFDPATGTWGAFDGQPNYPVNKVAVLADNELAIGGWFTAIGTQAIGFVAIWDGQHWTSLGGGASGGYPGVQVLQTQPNGDLVVGGSFTVIGAAGIAGLARWDGSQWHAFPAFSGIVNALAVRPNGNLVVTGTFPSNVAEWNGSAWSTFGPGVGGFSAVAVLANGDVVIGGILNTVKRWNGSTWSAMGSFTGSPRVLMPLANGDLIAASAQIINGVAVDGVVRWNGSQWTSVAPHIGTVYSMATLPSGDLVVAGALMPAPGEPIRGLATWDGSSWHAMAHGFDGAVRCLLPMANGDLVALGDFLLAEGVPISKAARWNGQAWWPMALMPTSPGCGTVDAAGDLWVAGSPTSTPASGNIARWTGTGWQTVGTAINQVTSLVIDDQQRPIVGTDVYPGYGQAVAGWNGVQWVGYGQGLDGPVRALRRRAAGDLVAGGEFLFSGTTSVSRIARWDGAAWQPFGPGLDGPVRALAELPNGDLIAAGDFVNDGTLVRPLHLIARWDGADWQPLGEGLGGDPGASVRTVLVLPDGDLIVGGDFQTAGGYPARGVARWDGTSWHEVDGGIDGTVLTLAQLPDGDLFAGGNFAAAGGHHAAHFARLRTDWPAASVAYGAGCAGQYGNLGLEAATLPWLGSTYRAVCYSVSATAFGLELFGLSPTQLSLATLHPAAGPGCSLLTNPELAMLRLPQGGTIDASLALPNAATLLGAQVYQQVLVGELGPGLAITGLASSNGLALVLGAF